MGAALAAVSHVRVSALCKMPGPVLPGQSVLSRFPQARDVFRLTRACWAWCEAQWRLWQIWDSLSVHQEFLGKRELWPWLVDLDTNFAG